MIVKFVSTDDKDFLNAARFETEYYMKCFCKQITAKWTVCV
jgi:hypothetical protein